MKQSNKAKRYMQSSTKKIFVGMVLFFIFTMLVITTIFSRQITNLNDKINNLSFELVTSDQMALSKSQLLSPSLIAENNTLAFPELRIAVPYDSMSNTLKYYYESYQDSNLHITSNLVGENPTMAQMSCQTLIRVNTSSNTPYSPWEKYAGEVKLNDGRTLYIIEAIAYENNEASTMYCPTTSWQQITPDIVAGIFKTAQSY